MSAEYTGTVFTGGDAHKVKTLNNRINTLAVAYASLLAEKSALQVQYNDLLTRHDRRRTSEERQAAPKATKPKPKGKRTRRTPQQMAAARA